MNVLTSKFPTKIQIDDMVYPINTDYRNCIRIINAFEGKELTYEEQVHVMLMRLYGCIPDNQELAIAKAFTFLDAGLSRNDNSSGDKRVYNFEKDGRYIYSAVKQTHNIDLEDVEYLHWWKFVFLFMDTGKDCMFNNFIYLRQKKNDGKLSQEEKKLWINLRDILDLDYTEEETEEQSEFMKLFDESDGDADAQQMVV